MARARRWLLWSSSATPESGVGADAADPFEREESEGAVLDDGSAAADAVAENAATIVDRREYLAIRMVAYVASYSESSLTISTRVIYPA